MRSSSDQYWQSLDHVRALAALLVFNWHFLARGGQAGFLAERAPNVPPFFLFDQGHTGVAIFMVLSGYLFAKILDGKDVDYKNFFWNRFIRLFPLLIAVFALRAVIVIYIKHGDAEDYLWRLLQGFVIPRWPNGGWSVAAEIHFYLVLPFILAFARRNDKWLLAFLVAAIMFRTLVFMANGEVQRFAYWTIGGRIDQFLIGIFAYMNRERLVGRPGWTIAVVSVFLMLAWQFDQRGGFTNFEGDGFPSHSAWWIIIPTIEAIGYAMPLIWYDANFKGSNSWISRRWADYGRFSYSIYLLHFFVTPAVPTLFRRFPLMDNIYIAIIAAFGCFLAMYPLGWLSFNLVEKPFLRLRKPYIKTAARQEFASA